MYFPHRHSNQLHDVQRVYAQNPNQNYNRFYMPIYNLVMNIYMNPYFNPAQHFSIFAVGNPYAPAPPNQPLLQNQRDFYVSGPLFQASVPKEAQKIPENHEKGSKNRRQRRKDQIGNGLEIACG